MLCLRLPDRLHGTPVGPLARSFVKPGLISGLTFRRRPAIVITQQVKCQDSTDAHDVVRDPHRHGMWRWKPRQRSAKASVPTKYATTAPHVAPTRPRRPACCDPLSAVLAEP